MDLNPALSAEQLEVLQSVYDLALACDYEDGHTNQVMRLALKLFDELQAFHRMDSYDKYLLQCGSLLHDIGWIEGWKGHHKTSLKIILNSPILKMDSKERLVVGSIARYHRRAVPDLKHDHYATLSVADRQVVSRLAAILRVADGLDRSHQNVVSDLKTQVAARTITILCQCNQPAYDEEQAALKKGDLFENTFHRKLVIQWTIQ